MLAVFWLVREREGKRYNLLTRNINFGHVCSYKSIMFICALFYVHFSILNPPRNRSKIVLGPPFNTSVSNFVFVCANLAGAKKAA